MLYHILVYYYIYYNIDNNIYYNTFLYININYSNVVINIHYVNIL